MERLPPPVHEFTRRLGELPIAWGVGKSAGDLWATLLVSGEAMTQDDLSKASGYSAGLVSASLSKLKDLGVVATVGRKGRKRLYKAIVSIEEGLGRFVKRFVDTEITPVVETLRARVHEIRNTRQRFNVERILEEYERSEAFLTSLLSTMKKHRNLPLKELRQVLRR